MECCVFIPADLEAGKILGTLVYNPTLMAVRGNYDQVNRLCSEVANTYGWGFVNINLRPYYSEGSKTLGYEVVEQLGWRLPDHIVAPLASILFTKIRKGLMNLRWAWWRRSPCAFAVPKLRVARRSLRPLPKAATSSLR